jgi:hypothetical protein
MYASGRRVVLCALRVPLLLAIIRWVDSLSFSPLFK